MSSSASTGTCWHSNYDQTRQFNSDYTQRGIRSYTYTDLLVCRSGPEVNREISIWKPQSTVLRNYVSLIRGVLFLLSAQITELLTVFLHPYSKFLPVFAALMQTLLPIVKSKVHMHVRGAPHIISSFCGKHHSFYPWESQHVSVLSMWQ